MGVINCMIRVKEVGKNELCLMRRKYSCIGYKGVKNGIEGIKVVVYCIKMEER